MSYSPAQPRDKDGKWTGESSARAPVTQSAGIKSVHGRAAKHPPIGGIEHGEGFTVNRRTGKDITKGVAVAGGNSGNGVGGGGGWMTERSNIVREETLAKSLGRKRQQVGVFNLATKEFIPTGGKTDPARAVSKRHKAA